MMHRLLTCLLFCIGLAVTAQTGTDTQTIFNDANTTLYSSTDKAQKSAGYLLKNATNATEKINALWLLSKIHNLKGEFTTATDLLFEANTVAENPQDKVRIFTAIAAQCRRLGIKDEAARYLDKAIIATGNPKNWAANSEIAHEKALQEMATRNAGKALRLLTELSANKITIPHHALLYNDIADAYRHLHNASAAEANYKRSIALANGNNEAAYAKVGLAGLLLSKKDPKGSIALILPVLLQMPNLNDNALKASVCKNLANSYNSLNDTANYKTYNEQYDTFNEAMNDERAKARIALLSHIDAAYETDMAKEETRFNLILYSGTGALFLCFVIAIVYFINLSRQYDQYQKIISRLEISKDNVVVETIAQSEAKTYSIPEKTEKTLLEKLAKFEESGKFINKSISLNTLARQLDTNTKYLSEIINTHKNGNFNAYINELRVKYILKKLQTDPVYLNYKVSYLAEESGFSSHSAFATVFKTVTGISPTTYINFLKQETQTATTALAGNE